MTTTTQAPPDRLVTKRELCERLSISRSTADDLVKHGAPCYRLGRGIRFDAAEVLRWLRENGRKPAA